MYWSSFSSWNNSIYILKCIKEKLLEVVRIAITINLTSLNLVQSWIWRSNFHCHLVNVSTGLLCVRKARVTLQPHWQCFTVQWLSWKTGLRHWNHSSENCFQPQLHILLVVKNWQDISLRWNLWFFDRIPVVFLVQRSNHVCLSRLTTLENIPVSVLMLVLLEIPAPKVDCYK